MQLDKISTPLKETTNLEYHFQYALTSFSFINNCIQPSGGNRKRKGRRREVPSAEQKVGPQQCGTIKFWGQLRSFPIFLLHLARPPSLIIRLDRDSLPFLEPHRKVCETHRCLFPVSTSWRRLRLTYIGVHTELDYLQAVQMMAYVQLHSQAQRTMALHQSCINPSMHRVKNSL
jgi:hypothetical protein